MDQKVCIIFYILLYSKCFGHVPIDVNNNLEKNCTCVPYYQCSFDSGDLVTDGKGLLDLRILENSPCQGYFDVCCNVSNDVLFPTTETSEKNIGCGYQNSGFFPWYAALFFQEKKQFPSTYRCGVSLIHPNAVLTAAHCVIGNGIWTVQIGKVTREISKIIIHPEYNRYTMQNGIALAILKQPFEISERINTICIPPPGTKLDNIHCKTTSRILDVKEDGTYLKMLHVTVVPKDKCINMLRLTRLGQFFQLHSSFLCAGKENNRNTCTGDGGSPLVCSVPGQPERYHQAGIVSWGIGCGENNVPDVYIKVSAFRDWIDVQMVNNGLEITSYRY